MTRRVTAAFVLVMLAAFVGWDLASSEPPNIYEAPPLIALGSGSAATGAHCAALPTD